VSSASAPPQVPGSVSSTSGLLLFFDSLSFGGLLVFERASSVAPSHADATARSPM